jgi:hypothetical protein
MEGAGDRDMGSSDGGGVANWAALEPGGCI